MVNVWVDFWGSFGSLTSEYLCQNNQLKLVIASHGWAVFKALGEKRDLK